MTKEKTPMFLFDLGGVVLAYDHEYTYESLVKLGVPREKAFIFNDCEEYLQFARGLIDENVFCNALRVHLGAAILTNDQLKRAHHLHIYGLVPGMKELIEELSVHHKIAFLTDTNVWQTERQQELIDLSKYPVISSHILGMRKSDPEIVDGVGRKKNFFSESLRILDVLPSEVLFIDDSPEKIEVAQRNGISGVLFTGTREALEADIANFLR